MFLSKRKKFVFIAVVLSVGFVGINFLSDQYRFLAIGGLTALTTIFFVWSLWEGLGRNATLLTLILPTLFTLGVGLFWFLLPAVVIARLPVVFLYGMGIYALCLTANIYTVSAVRTIALMRAAKGVGFVLTLLTGFLLYDAVLSIKSPIWISVPIVFLASFPLFLQGIWVSDLKQSISQKIIINSAIFSLGLAQIASLLYFWPVTVVVGSLFLTVGMYILLGLGQAQEEGRLFRQTVREYITVGLVVFIAMFLATRWGG